MNTREILNEVEKCQLKASELKNTLHFFTKIEFHFTEISKQVIDELREQLPIFGFYVGTMATHGESKLFFIASSDTCQIVFWSKDIKMKITYEEN